MNRGEDFRRKDMMHRNFYRWKNTVVDKGSKLVKESASFFEMLIAFIKSIFEKLFSFFK